MRRFPTAVAIAVLVLVGGGCSQVKDAAVGAASQAASQAGKAAADEVKRQICATVQDGQVSAQDKQVLSGLVSAAKSAGLPVQVTAPLNQIAQSGDQVPTESVTQLRNACAPSAASSSGVSGG